MVKNVSGAVKQLNTSTSSSKVEKEYKDDAFKGLSKSEKKELQDEERTRYVASDNWLHSAMSTITGRPNEHEW